MMTLIRFICSVFDSQFVRRYCSLKSSFACDIKKHSSPIVVKNVFNFKLPPNKSIEVMCMFIQLVGVQSEIPVTSKYVESRTTGI